MVGLVPRGASALVMSRILVGLFRDLRKKISFSLRLLMYYTQHHNHNIGCPTRELSLHPPLGGDGGGGGMV